MYHCALGAGEANHGHGWGEVTFKFLEDGTYWINVTAHDLHPGVEYELRSGGAFTPALKATANGGGNVFFMGTADDLGAAFNVWDGPSNAGLHRVLRTDLATCMIPQP